jgi:trypsin
LFSFMRGRDKIMMVKLWNIIALSLIVSNSYAQETRAGVRKKVTKDGAQARIVGGQPASPSRYPYACSLTQFGAHFCGGSLIAPDMVLSAAHCGGMATSIELGRYDRSSLSETYESIRVEQEFRHPRYNVDDIVFDQMLVKLSEPSSETTVRINSDESIPASGQEVTVIGWGLTDGNDENSASDILQEASLSAISNEECSAAKNPNLPLDSYQGAITDDMVCAIDNGQDACSGDSGE